MNNSQTAFPFDPGSGPLKTKDVRKTREAESMWLGLVIDHRRLQEALQDEWLHPDLPNGGWVLGVQAYSAMPPSSSKHTIPVRIKLDAERLPKVEARVRHDSDWIADTVSGRLPRGLALFWPGALPIFAIRELAVPSDEQRNRLLGLTQQLANVDLSDAAVIVNAEDGQLVESVAPPSDVKPILTLLPKQDAMRGAMSMAVWAIPRINPWLDVLVASLSQDHKRLKKATESVGASWWQFPPWSHTDTANSPKSLQQCLWLAATETFAEAATNGGLASSELAQQVATRVMQGGAASKEVERWRCETHGILRGEASIAHQGFPRDWQNSPVEIAIQLVLLRPDPMAFKTWCKDMPDMPPAVWWSAAVLCGLLRGYRRLAIQFRGPLGQREALAARVQLIGCGMGDHIQWPCGNGKPDWRSAGESNFTLLWGDRSLSSLRIQARGAWHLANFNDSKVLKEAESIAKNLRWQGCWHQEIELPPGIYHAQGSGRLDLKGDEVAVRNDSVRIQLPPGASVSKHFDPEAFRNHVTVEAGALPAPPLSKTPGGWLGIPGLCYQPNFLCAEEEEDLIQCIDAGEWQCDLKRRVQHYGWKYDYEARKVGPTTRLGPLPDWATKIGQRLVDQRLLAQPPDQVIVNEYRERQGISKHVDKTDSFEDGIAMISLAESWQMVFRLGERKEVGTLEQRSVTVMTGDSRYKWTHEIPARKYEPGPPKRKRHRRISLTFRKVAAQGNGRDLDLRHRSDVARHRQSMRRSK